MRCQRILGPNWGFFPMLDFSGPAPNIGILTRTQRKCEKSHHLHRRFKANYVHLDCVLPMKPLCHWNTVTWHCRRKFLLSPPWQTRKKEEKGFKCFKCLPFVAKAFFDGRWYWRLLPSGQISACLSSLLHTLPRRLSERQTFMFSRVIYHIKHRLSRYYASLLGQGPDTEIFDSSTSVKLRLQAWWRSTEPS